MVEVMHAFHISFSDPCTPLSPRASPIMSYTSDVDYTLRTYAVLIQEQPVDDLRQNNAEHSKRTALYVGPGKSQTYVCHATEKYSTGLVRAQVFTKLLSMRD